MMIQEKMKRFIPDGAKVEYSGNTAVFEVPVARIKEVIGELYATHKLPLKLITATDERKENGCFKIWYVLGVPQENAVIIAFIRLEKTTEFPSLTLTVHEASNYERKIQTFFGLVPVGHPDTRPLILHENWPENVFPLRKDFKWNTRPPEAHGEYHFQKVEGEGIYEIPVGPIHAGIIEPGHFRFSVAGERIVLLEPRLGFTHKGSEKLFETLSLNDAVKLSEKISGDSSFGHSLAFCQAVEQLGDIVVSQRARYLRVIYAELERLANHFGDIGAIMTDTGFNFGGAQGSRLREMVMRINERITGSRFLRGVNVIGGVTQDIDNQEREQLDRDMTMLAKDFSEVMDVSENSASLLNRLKGTGVLAYDVACDRGIVGIAGRALDMHCDVRVDYPYAAYDEIATGDIPTEHDGDVSARFHVRVKEVYASIEMIHNALETMPAEDMQVLTIDIKLKKNAVAVSMVEGWRGEIVYFITTDAKRLINRVSPRDPSFVNWSLLRDAGFDNVVPDFPLINKSFNLSYTGNDM